MQLGTMPARDDQNVVLGGGRYVLGTQRYSVSGKTLRQQALQIRIRRLARLAKEVDANPRSRHLTVSRIRPHCLLRQRFFAMTETSH